MTKIACLVLLTTFLCCSGLDVIPVMLPELTVGVPAGNASMRRCGSIITCINKDTEETDQSVNNVFHQPKGSARDQRCMWILSSPRATSYTLVVSVADYVTVNQVGRKNRLPVAGIIVAGATFMKNNLTINHVNSTGVFTIKANVVYITTWSRGAIEDVGGGVVIHYQASTKVDGGVPAVENSRHRLLLPGTNIYHPVNNVALVDRFDGRSSINPANKNTRELSSYVLLPADNKVIVNQNGKPISNMNVVYTRIFPVEDMGCEVQKISVYSFVIFNRIFPTWELQKVICDNVNSINFITHDIFILVVQGNHGVTDQERDFNLTYTD